MLIFSENEENHDNARHEGGQNLESPSEDSPPTSGPSVEEDFSSLSEAVKSALNKNPDTKHLSEIRSMLHNIHEEVDRFYQTADKGKAVDEDQEAKMETCQAAEGSANNLPQQKKPINFKDCIGRRFEFPFESCSTWQVGATPLHQFRIGILDKP